MTDHQSPFPAPDPHAAETSPHSPGPHSSTAVHPPLVGRYRILSVIGQGGMGIVYQAEQHNPRRIVALKVIKPGLMSPDMLRRFEFEANVLGRLHHPGIAQIFEAGTFDLGFGAQPFFAMEFIQGRPLTEFVFDKGTPLSDHLDLIVQIADAVHHAHTKGVVHRDLKPSNIMVTAPSSSSTTLGADHAFAYSVGQIKILDFGVARAVDADLNAATIQTSVGQLVGTLPYMSPEQVAADPADIDPRSDVYALGVIMYELLAHRLPYDLDRKSVAQSVRVISEVDAPPLSSIDRLYRGDLETIVSKALEKDRARRYQSALEFAADIRRFVRDEPIIARPASSLYLLSKFARRNRALVGGIIAVFAALLAGVTFTTIGFARARAAESLARQEADRANTAQKHAESEAANARAAEKLASLQASKASAINDFLIKNLLGAANPTVAQGREITVAMILDQATASVGSAFADQPELEGSIRLTLAETWTGISQYQKAFDQYAAAHAALLPVLGPANEQTISALIGMASAENYLGQYQQSLDRLLAVKPNVLAALGPSHRLLLTIDQLIATNYNDLAQFQIAEPLFRDLLIRQTAALTEDHEDTQVTVSNYAYLLAELGRFSEAEPLFRKTWEYRKARFGPAHPRTIAAMGNLAVTLSDMSRLDEAEALNRQAFDDTRRILGPDHVSTLDAMGNLAAFLGNLGKSEEALTLMTECCQRRESALGRTHPLSILCRSELVALLRDNGRIPEAIILGLQVVAECEESLGHDHPDTNSARQALAVCYYHAKDYPAAETWMRRIYETALRIHGEHHPDSISAGSNLCALLVRLDQFDEADGLFARILPLTEEVNGPTHRQTLNTCSLLAGLRKKQNRLPEARDLLQRVLTGRADLLGPDHPDTVLTHQDLVDLHLQMNRPDLAEPLALSLYHMLASVSSVDAAATAPDVSPPSPEIIANLSSLVTVYDRLNNSAQRDHFQSILTAAIAATQPVQIPAATLPAQPPG